MVILNDELNKLQAQRHELLKKQDSEKSEEAFLTQEEIDELDRLIYQKQRALLIGESPVGEPVPEKQKVRSQKDYYKYLTKQYKYHVDKMLEFRAERKRIRELK